MWPRRLANNVGQALVVLVAVVLVTFLLVRLVPGDPATGILGTHGDLAAATALRHALHLDRTLPVQFQLYVTGLLHGDLGNSLVQQGRSVAGLLGQTLPVTLAVVVVTILISGLVGTFLGLAAGLANKRGIDLAIRGFAVVLLSTPPFFLGLVLLVVVGLSLQLLPAGGWVSGWPGSWRYVVLPSLALSGYLAPVITRTIRQAVLDTRDQPFVEAAVARGLRPRQVRYRHILPNSLLPVITLVGLNMGALIGGAVVIEAVFGLPGIGAELVQAVSLRDYPVIQGIAIVSAVIVVAANLLADIAYVFVDPRTRRKR